MRAPPDRPTTIVMVLDDATEATVSLVRTRTPDLTLVDALVRLQLLARRRGWRLLVRDASDELRALLELVGLAGLLVLEPRRQPEVGEQLGVDEVVQSRDPGV